MPEQPNTHSESDSTPDSTQANADGAKLEPAPPELSERQAETERVDESFEEMLEQGPSLDSKQELKSGDKVSGVLAQIGAESSFVDFGGRSEGVIKTAELRDSEGQLGFSVGDPLEAFVVGAGEEIALSRFLGRQESNRSDLLYQAYKSGVPVEGKVTAINKWGLGVEIQGVRAFCPVAQIDTKFTADTEEFRDRTMQFKIIRFRDQGRTITLSRRALLEEAQRQEANEARVNIKAGASLRGTVTRVESFGAFVDLGAGVEGLVHVSELSHDRVEDPKQVVASGQEIGVVVLAVKNLGDLKKERISLSTKALEKDPWDEARKQFRAGSVANGKVDSIEEFGAFVELAPNVTGMVHISEMDDKRISHPREVVSVGDEVRVAVLGVDSKRRRLKLSIKQAERVEDKTNLKEFQQRQKKEEESRDSGTAMMDALKKARLIE